MNEAGGVRRIVTGHDGEGAAVIQQDCLAPRTLSLGGGAGPTFHEIWNTRASPAPIDRASGEPPEQGIVLAPPRRGTRIRVVDFPPDPPELATMTPEQARAGFAEIGAAGASSHSGTGARHAHMHRTETIDYGIVVDGEIVLIVDKDETAVRAGEIVIQRGTNHAWANRSGRNCRVVFVLIDGTFEEGLDEPA